MRDPDGREGFDFLFGRWHVVNLYRENPAADTEWIEFNTVAEARPILGGLGNIDTFSFAGTDTIPAWDASTVRLYEPRVNLWRIYWASSRYPGPFGAPMEGRFQDGEGQFYGEELIDDETFAVRFRWTHEGDASARWEQALKSPAENTWQTNWIMNFTRA